MNVEHRTPNVRIRPLVTLLHVHVSPKNLNFMWSIAEIDWYTWHEGVFALASMFNAIVFPWCMFLLQNISLLPTNVTVTMITHHLVNNKKEKKKNTVWQRFMLAALAYSQYLWHPTLFATPKKTTKRGYFKQKLVWLSKVPTLLVTYQKIKKI